MEGLFCLRGRWVGERYLTKVLALDLCRLGSIMAWMGVAN
jgi:hypothetical protein